jgi:hypothetical protein
MDTAAWALVLSGLAIVVSLGLGIAGYRLQRQVTAIATAHRSEELEARGRADLHARLDPPGRPDYIVLSASGATSARDVVVEVEPRTILLEGEPMSFPSLEPGQEARMHLAITRDDFPPSIPRVVVVHVKWEDNRGPQGKDLTLTV